MLIPRIEELSDDALEKLNASLPWAAFLEDSRGRRFGRPSKRNTAQTIPDRRIQWLERKVPLGDMRVLEIGCFEGIHTVALAQRARKVVAVDSRVENVLKTIVRCWAFDVEASVGVWDVERPAPPTMDLDCDLLFHFGVLYHLSDPVGHLRAIRPFISSAVLLDTHVAVADKIQGSYVVDGREYEYQSYTEPDLTSPFAGMRYHAKWLREEDLEHVLTECGFGKVTLVERRDERNGPRVLIMAAA